jgi:nucleotide-binding universal stress UspA family protein
MTKVYTVLVPTDFSEAADCATDHAAKVASIFKGEIQLLHVVSKDKQIDAAKQKLQDIAKNVQEKKGVTTKVIVKKGNIFDDIGEVAREIGASLILMGTHGVKGIQHLVGSYALKVIMNSEVPFIITQKKGPNQGYNNIVVPISYEEESKQKLTLIVGISKHFGAKVHIFSPKESDEFLRSRLNRQLQFTKKYLEERSVAYDMTLAEEKGDFTRQTAEYAKKIAADLIAVINTGDKGILSDILGGSGGEQDLISNKEEIPVIIMNPTQKFVAESFG